MIPKADTALFGAAGEHYAMSQLLRRNMVAGLAPPRAPNADIIVSDLANSAFAAVQVKTCRDADGWRMNAKHEEVRPRLFYCFVSFDSDDQIRSWIVPSKIVSKALMDSYRNWLSRSSKDGTPHTEIELRWMRTTYRHLPEKYGPEWLTPYQDAWNTILS